MVHGPTSFPGNYNIPGYGNNFGSGNYDDTEIDSDAKLVINLEAGSAQFLLPDGTTKPVSKEQMEKILADNGIKLDSKTKTFLDTDGFTIEPGAVNAASLGGSPVLPSVGKSANVNSTTNVNALKNAINRFGDEGMFTNALAFQGLMAILHSSQKDRETNMEMTNTAHGMKNTMIKVEINSKDQIMKAKVEQAERGVRKAWVEGIVSVGISAAGAATGGGTGAMIANAVGSAVKMVYNIIERSGQEEGTASRQKAEREAQQAKIEEEVIGQMLEAVKEGASDNKDEFKRVKKLLLDVVQRQSDAVRSVSNA